MAFAQGLADAGASVALLDMLEPVIPTSELSKQYGVTIRYYKTNVTSLESLQASFDAIKSDFDNRLDILVACAGVNKNVHFLDTTEKDFDGLFNVNARGVYFTAQLAAKAMIENGTKVGSIILVASIASHMAIRSQRSSAYCGTKGAVRAMVPGIAAEMNKYGIRVNSISPGYVKTVREEPPVILRFCLSKR
jgi:NAD(P)-dependent dehydrogenase (short-subunit alcohol dehydrogenase family)